jgi:tetratricopeptide (TPR) repeat protein
LIGLLRGCSERSPILLVVHDIQWAGSAGLGFLDQLALAMRVEPMPLLAVCTLRTTELLGRPELLRDLARLSRFEGEQVHRLLVGAMSQPETEDLVASILGRSDLGPAIHRRSGGNPLYSTVLAQHLAAQDATSATAAELTRQPLPPDLRDLLEDRLRRQCDATHVPDLARWCVQAVMVLGSEAAWDRLMAMASRTRRPPDPIQLEGVLEELLDQAVLHEQAEGNTVVLQLEHALLGEVALSRMSNRRKKRMHEQAMQVLLAEGELRGHRALRVWEHAIAAGDRPTRLVASEPAMAELKRLGRVQEATEALLDLATDPSMAEAKRWTLRDRAAYELHIAGKEDRAKELWTALSDNPAPEARAMGWLGRACQALQSDDLAECELCLERADRACEGVAEDRRGRLADRRTLVLGGLLDARGELDSFERTATERLAEGGSDRSRAQLMRQLGRIAQRSGRVQAANGHFAGGLSLALDAQEGHLVCDLQRRMAELLRSQGRLAEARELLDDARVRARREGRPRSLPPVLIGLAAVERSAQDPSEAGVHLDEADALLESLPPCRDREHGRFRCALERSLLALLEGRASHALRSVDKSHAQGAPAQWDAVVHLARAAALLRLGRSAEADAAIAAWSACALHPIGPDAAWLSEEVGMALARHGHHEAAAPLLESAGRQAGALRHEGMLQRLRSRPS